MVKDKGKILDLCDAFARTEAAKRYSYTGKQIETEPEYTARAHNFTAFRAGVTSACIFQNANEVEGELFDFSPDQLLPDARDATRAR